MSAPPVNNPNHYFPPATNAKSAVYVAPPFQMRKRTPSKQDNQSVIVFLVLVGAVWLILNIIGVAMAFVLAALTK